MIIHHVRPAPDKRNHGYATQLLPPIKADLADCVIIPLTHQQKAVAHLSVDIAFSYHVAADDELLLHSLSRTLTDFPVLCVEGRSDYDEKTLQNWFCVSQNMWTPKPTLLHWVTFLFPLMPMNM